MVALLAACGGSSTGPRALLVVVCRAGFRVGEALALRPADLDPAAGTLRVPRGKTGHRTVGLDPETLALVEHWATRRRAALCLNGRRRPFCTIRAGSLQPSCVRSMLKQLAVRGDIESRAHARALRHIRLQLGHSDCYRS